MKRFGSLFIAFIIVFTATTGLFAQALVRDEPIGQFGNELRIANLGDPKTFNPHLAMELASTSVLNRYVFEGLVSENGVTTALEPSLARDWEFSEDGRVWTFYLREGVHWHDGVEFTADDVIFNFDLIYDPDIPNAFEDGLTIAGKPLQYEKVDRYTVRFTLPEPFAPMLRQMAFALVPKHILETPWREGRFNETWGVDTPPEELVGTGPFIMQQYRPNEHIVYERNPNYWQVDTDGNTLPYLSRFIIHIAASQDVMRLLFDNRDIHLYAARGDEVTEYYDTDHLDHTVYDGGPTFGSLLTVFNQNELHTPAPQVNWFQNRAFRRAVAHALDRQSIMDIVFGGYAVEQWTAISAANQEFLNENVRTYPYDLDEAARLLAEAGFVKGADGKLRDPDGHVVEFQLTTNYGNAALESIGALLKEDLAELGMDVDFDPLDFNLINDRMASGENWQALIIGMAGGVEPHDEQRIWRHDGRQHMWNVGRDDPQTEWEARVNELFDLGATTIDPDLRRQYYMEFQEIIADEVPVIYSISGIVHMVVRDNVKNVQFTAFGGAQHNIASIWIDD